MSPDPVAAIDCGTNSTRLLVVDGGGRPLQRLSRVTRLGQGVDRTKRLQPEAISRTVEVLGEYRRVMDGFGVRRVRMTATSAARDASNPPAWSARPPS
jgi:exopolyphosphatase/guanosine-5'-triphosphate,3'-diphosphate pyrophosphatase